MTEELFREKWKKYIGNSITINPDRGYGALITVNRYNPRHPEYIKDPSDRFLITNDVYKLGYFKQTTTQFRQITSHYSNDSQYHSYYKTKYRNYYVTEHIL